MRQAQQAAIKDEKTKKEAQFKHCKEFIVGCFTHRQGVSSLRADIRSYFGWTRLREVDYFWQQQEYFSSGVR